jgi:hypothetical protein
MGGDLVIVMRFGGCFCHFVGMDWVRFSLLRRD